MAFGCGAGAYFTLPGEPQSWVAIALAPIAAALLFLGSRRASSRAGAAGLVLLASALGGFALAKLRTESLRTPIAGAEGRPVLIEGWVVDVASPGQGGQRLLIAPYQIGNWAPAETPIRVRVTLKGGYVPAPGEAIKLLAVINAPPPPASPGAYDFARDAYFLSVGGVGFALGPVQTWESPRAPPARLRLNMRINAARWALTRQIVDSMGLRTGGLAAAMTTGGEVQVTDARADHMEMLLRKMRAMGAEIDTTSGITLRGPSRVLPVDVATLPYPGVATDYKPIITAMLATASGVSVVTENLFDGRFRYVDELIKMGAVIETDGHHAVVHGTNQLHGADVLAHDIRAGAACVIVGLLAPGTTHVSGVEHLERGYDDLPGRLRSLGAKVERV